MTQRPPFEREADGQVMHRAAEMAIRCRIRQAVVEGGQSEPRGLSALQVEALEDALCAAIADRRIAWAVAYMAGVVMAPDFVRQYGGPHPGARTLPGAGARTPAAQPTAAGAVGGSGGG